MAHPHTPNLDRLTDTLEDRRTIGAFLDWLAHEKKIVLMDLARMDPGGDAVPAEKLLAEYFGVDLEAAEGEARLIKAYCEPKGARA